MPKKGLVPVALLGSGRRDLGDDRLLYEDGFAELRSGGTEIRLQNIRLY
jgi:hypothetical protein